MQVTFTTGFTVLPVLWRTPLSRPCQKTKNKKTKKTKTKNKKPNKQTNKNKTKPALRKRCRFTSDNTVTTALCKRFKAKQYKTSHSV